MARANVLPWRKTGEPDSIIPASRREAAERPPLCVDLDGTLVATDTLHECVFAVSRNLPVLLRVPGWLLKGKAHLKQRLAASANLDAALLPYRGRLVDYLRQQKEQGRRVILATAADRRIADDVARHLAVFDGVVASDGARNLRGAEKVAALREHLGGVPFTYVGNDRSDLPVWRHARSAVLVNAAPAVARAAARTTEVEEIIDDRAHWLPALVRAMRPHQWVKNILVLIPILTAGALFDLRAYMDALTMFVAFCCTASGIYLINDLTDLDADRRHPHKRRRPFASGALPIGVGLAAIPLLLGAGALFGAAGGAPGIVAIYGAASLLYSMKLKTMPLVDIFMLAGLYTIRLFAGGEATGYEVSMWLLAFSSFLFLSLAAIKRVAELTSMKPAPSGRLSGRGYLSGDDDILRPMGVSASFVSAAVLALYVQNDLLAGEAARASVYWAVVPLLLFWQCRLWLATARGTMHDDPIVFAAKDWVSWLVGGGAFAVVIVAHLA